MLLKNTVKVSSEVGEGRLGSELAIDPGDHCNLRQASDSNGYQTRSEAYYRR